MPKDTQPTFSETDFLQSSQDFAQRAARVIDTAVRKAYQNLTPEERAKFATHDGQQFPDRLVRTLIIAAAFDALDNEFNATAIDPDANKVKRILKRRP